MLRKINHSVPWILLLVVLIQFVRGLAMPYGVLILYLLSIYALFDIYQSRGDGDTLLYWSLFGCAVGGIFPVVVLCPERMAFGGDPRLRDLRPAGADVADLEAGVEESGVAYLGHCYTGKRK